VQAIKMSLMLEIFRGGEFDVYALRLKDDSDLSAQLVGILCGVVAHNDGATPDWNHQGRKNTEERGLAASVGTQQAEEFGAAHIERDPVQRGAILVAVHEVLNRNDGGLRGETVRVYQGYGCV